MTIFQTIYDVLIYYCRLKRHDVTLTKRYLRLEKRIGTCLLTLQIQIL